MHPPHFGLCWVLTSHESVHTSRTDLWFVVEDTRLWTHCDVNRILMSSKFWRPNNDISINKAWVSKRNHSELGMIVVCQVELCGQCLLDFPTLKFFDMCRRHVIHRSIRGVHSMGLSTWTIFDPSTKSQERIKHEPVTPKDRLVLDWKNRAPVGTHKIEHVFRCF